MFRLDRSLTLYVAQPWLRLAGHSMPSLPVLMYHSICDDPEDHRSAYYKTNTSVAGFARQMTWLSEAGYRGLDLGSALAEFEQSASSNVVAITFDDGYRDFHTFAFPVLQERKFSATMYVPSAYVAHRRRTFNGRECLTWSEARELRKHGIAIGSHTVSHQKLPTLGDSDLHAELIDSKHAIEDALGEPVSDFAHPFAYPKQDKDYISRFKEILISAGYQTNATTQIGRFTPQGDKFEIPRLPMNSLDDQALTRAKLNGAYDWLAVPQAGVKKCKGWFRPAS